MPQVRQVAINNRLLLALQPSTLERLRAALEPMAIARGQTIDRVNVPIEHLYFVNCGLISTVKTMRDGRSVEVSAVGVEGLTDPYSLFGLDAAVLDTIVQIPGDVFRIRREVLIRAMSLDGSLRQIIQDYARFAFGELAQTAACNRLHSLEERCCRWLLVAQDSALADRFPLTHEFLAMMLGVQRSGVSITARALKTAGFIDYTRAQVKILNRRGLEATACECYQTSQDELNVLFAPSLGRLHSAT